MEETVTINFEEQVLEVTVNLETTFPNPSPEVEVEEVIWHKYDAFNTRQGFVSIDVTALFFAMDEDVIIKIIEKVNDKL